MSTSLELSSVKLPTFPNTFKLWINRGLRACSRIMGNQGKISKKQRPSPFFFSFLVECVFWFWVGRSEKKKKKTKIKLKRSLELDGLVPQHNIREAWETTRCGRKVNMAAMVDRNWILRKKHGVYLSSVILSRIDIFQCLPDYLVSECNNFLPENRRTSIVCM